MKRFRPRTVTVLAGSGGNGGGGLVAARHLANAGVDVSVALGQPPNALAPVPSHQYDIIERIGVSVIDEPARADVVIDAQIGCSLRGAPRGRIGELVERIGDLGDRVVALDTPSGMDVTTGSVPGVAVTADLTMTLGLPKIGLRGQDRVGELYLADISIPPSVYAAIGVGPAPDFTSSSILRVLRANASTDAAGASWAGVQRPSGYFAWEFGASVSDDVS
ncbi:MAG: NAD(P)H-hydrate epimerase [Ilumatobacteraceae bacterium]